MTEEIVKKIIKSMGSVGSLLIHTVLFISAFILYFSNIFEKNTILLILTTIVSLEAIYLSILIQMSVNLQSKKFEDLKKDVEEIQEDVEEIQENVEDIQEDVEEIQEDVEELNEEEEEEEDDEDIKEIKATLNKLMKEVINLKNKK